MPAEVSSTSVTLIALADTVEANVKGPSRRLDGDIAEALQLHPAGEWSRPNLSGQPEFFKRKGDAFSLGRGEWSAPRLTASIDESLTLLPTDAVARTVIEKALYHCAEATETQEDFRRRLPSFVCASVLRRLAQTLSEQGA